VFVVDASVALAWCFADETSDYADRILGRLEQDEAVAPAIWSLELSNGLRTAERRGRLHASELPRLRELLRALPVKIEPVELRAALSEVLELARSLDLTSYDASYVALAARRGMALATADARLRAACEQARVEVLA